MTVILGPTATLPQQTFAGIWMTLLVFVWDAALAAAISPARSATGAESAFSY